MITALPGYTIQWPQLPPGISLPLAMSAFILGATDRCAMIGRVRWEDGGTHDIAEVDLSVGDGVVGSGSTVRISLQDVSTTAGPPTQPDGVADQSWSGPTPSPNAYTTFVLDTPRLAVAQGTLLAVVSEFTTFGSGSQFRLNAWYFADTRPLYTELPAFYSGGAWTGRGYVPTALLRSSDGTLGVLGWVVPVTDTEEAFNNASTPDERGLEFVAEQPLEIDELWGLVGAAGDYNLVLYEGDVAVRTASFSAAAAYSATLTAMARGPIEPYTLTVGLTYRVVVQPTTANNVYFNVVNIPDGGQRAFWCGTGAGYVSRVDAGAWDAIDPLKLPMCGVGISGMDDGTGPDISGSHLISGTVTHEGTLISGATVRLIRQSDNGVLTTTTDVNGEYSFSVAEGYLYHAMVEYESGGARYSAKSLFDLEPTIA